MGAKTMSLIRNTNGNYRTKTRSRATETEILSAAEDILR
jgi:hypothetical protein